MKRRIISILTALALCLSLLPPTALAQSTGTVTITGTDPATPVTLEDGKFYVINEESTGGVTAQDTAPESGAYLTYANGVMTVHGTNGTILFLYGQLAMSDDLTIKYAGDENFVVEWEGSSPALALNGHTLTLDAGMGLIVVNTNKNASCPPVDTGTIRFADKPYTYDGSIAIMSYCEAASGALTVENAGYVNIIGTTASGPVIDNLTVRNCDMVEVSQHSKTNTTLSNVVGNITTDRPVFLYVNEDTNDMAGIKTPAGGILECEGKIDSTFNQGQSRYIIDSTDPILYQAGMGIIYYEPATEDGGKAVLTLDNAYFDENILISGTTRGTAGSLELNLNGENGMWITAYFPTTTTLTGTGSFDGVLLVSGFENKSTGTLNAVVGINRDGLHSYTVYGERSTSDSWLGGATFTAGIPLTIAEGAVLTVDKDKPLKLDNSQGASLINHGTIINNGTIAITAAENAQDADILAFIKGLNLTGTGLVGVAKGYSQGASKDTYTNAGVKMLGPVGELDLSNKTTGEDKLDTQGYKWEVTKGTDGSGNEVITSGKLTLAPGFNAEKVTLPDAAVEIVTEGDGRIGELGFNNPQKTKLTFSGEGLLTVDERINLAGGDNNELAVNEGAKVIANGGIYIGASGGVNSKVTVNGTLNAKGGVASAISAGSVAVGNTGVLEVSGAEGVLLNGMPKNTGAVYTGLFTVIGDGRFTADCSEYNVMVAASGDSFPEGTTAEGAIPLGDEYMPDDCKAIQKDNKINLVRISTGEVYNGPITIHQNHDWKDTWSIDQNNHWHACTFAGCDKKKEEDTHNFDNSGVCTGCKAKLEVTLTGADNLVYDGNAKEPDVNVTITGKEADKSHTLVQNIDYEVTYADNTNAGEGKVTVAHVGAPDWKVTKTFSIAKAPLTATVTAAEKTYDGSDTADVSVTFTGLQNSETLTLGTDYTVTGKFENANAGDGKTVSGTVTLLDSSEAKNYELSNGSFTTTANIIKATVSGTVAHNLNIANKLASTYTFLLSNLRPQITGNWGEVEYKISVNFTQSGYYNNDAEIIKDSSGALNTLSLPILANPVETTGRVGTVTVTVKSTNYEDFTNTINIIAQNKKKVNFSGVEGVTAVYNGQQVAGYTGTLTMTDSDGKPVNLTPEIHYTGRSSTSWDDADTPPTDAGTYSVIFRVPDDNPDYIGRSNVPFEIKPADVVITADDKRATVGSAMPELTYTVAGLVGGDALKTEPTLACDADMSKAGSYTITASGAEVPNSNYEITKYVPGTLTVRTGGGGSSGGGGGVYSYTVTVEESEGGSVAADRRTAFSGETVALTVIPEEGYELQSIAAADIWGSEVKLAEDGGRYTFTMPSRDVTVTAVFAPSAPKPCDGGEGCPSRAFTDLATVGSWYHEAVDYVLEKGLMDGYGNGTFGPDDSLSRGQLARILYNLEGRPAPEGQSPFPDVREGKWYTAAIAWAAERKVVLGYDDGTFGPNDPVTREQLAAMLWRYGGRPLAVNEELDFADAGKVSAYAREALRWAVEQGIVQGKGGGVLDPKGSATRAEAAAMLMRFLEK